MKRVGIILRDYKSISNKELLAIRKDLLATLSRYNIYIICIPINFNGSNFEYQKAIKLINECDGIIIPGGSEFYKMDIRIAKYLYDIDKPTLGICLGMQILSLAFNGKVQTLNSKKHESDKLYAHKVYLKENSKLKRILRTNYLLVNSRHSDYVFKTDLNIVGLSDDFIIEAIEAPNKRFFIGVEWHPESLNDIYSKRLFDSFIDSL